MTMRDHAHNIHVVPAFAPAAAVTDNTPQVSAIVDLLGYNSATLVFNTGTLSDADATFTVLIEESDNANLSSGNAVADDDLIYTEAAVSFTFADDGEARKIGYIGNKRYVRATITPANNTGNLFLAGNWVLGRPHTAPVAQPT